MKKIRGIWGNSALLADVTIRRSIPNWFHSISPQGTLIEVSDTWAEALGYTAEEMLGTKSVDHLTPSSRARAEREYLPEFFRTGVLTDADYVFQRKDGTLLPVKMNAFSLAEKGRITQSYAFMHDNTEGAELSEMQIALHILLAELKTMPGNGGKARAIEVLAQLVA